MEPIKPADDPSWWVIGIDAGDWQYIDPLMEAGRMPVMRRLISSGVRAELQTVIPPYSAPAWTTFATGCLPGKHGVFDFLQNIPGSYEIRTTIGGDRQVPAYWQILDELNIPTVTVNVPMTYPPDPVSGFMISGLDAPIEGPAMTHPPKLWEELRKRWNYKIYPPPKERTLEEYTTELWDVMRIRSEIFLQLMQRSEARVGTIVFASVDMLSHLCLNSGEPHGNPHHELIFKTYERVDKIIGDMLKHKPDHTGVIIVSDHGAGLLTRLLNLDQWLTDLGYLHGAGYGASGGMKQAVWSKARSALLWANRVTPRSLRKRFSKFKQLKKHWEAVLWYRSIDWTQTRAFTCNLQGIYINLEGRYPQGVVTQQEYPQLVDEITQRLYELKDPETGAPMVDKVHHRDQAYPGPFSIIGPDLYIMWNRGFMARVRKTGDLFITPQSWEMGRPMPSEAIELWTGGHTSEGIFVAQGPGVKSGVELNGIRIQDVAPTLLAVLGVAAPEYMDGRVIKKIFQSQPDQIHQAGSGDNMPQADRPFSQEEEQARINRLKNLGYL